MLLRWNFSVGNFELKLIPEMQSGMSFLEGEVASGHIWKEKPRVIADDDGQQAEKQHNQNQNLDLVIKVSVPDWKVMAFSAEPGGQLVWERQVGNLKFAPVSDFLFWRRASTHPAPCLLQFCTPIASAWLVGGGKVTPIALFDDNGYSNQSEADEEDEDDDVKKSRRSSESSVYLGKGATSQSRLWRQIDVCFDRIGGGLRCSNWFVLGLSGMYQGQLYLQSSVRISEKFPSKAIASEKDIIHLPTVKWKPLIRKSARS